MIKFFRKIRRNLLSENKISRYLAYAIGEIVLVVIGILIALQINNWNEGRKEEKKIQDIYLQLIEDLNRDRDYATFIIDKFEIQRKSYKEYLDNFSKAKLNRKTMYNDLLKLNMESYPINFNTSTIESLQNSGEIALIPPALRNKLINLRRQQQKITMDESLDNRAKMGVTEQLTMLIGELSLEERLEHQVELKSQLKIEENINEIILALEAIQGWMNFSELKSIRLLNELLDEMNVVEDLIRKEIESD